MSELNDKDYDALKKMLEFETTHPKEEWYLGWE